MASDSDQQLGADLDDGRGLGIAALVLALFGFSWGFVLTKLIGLPAPVLAFWRLLLGASILGGIALVLRVRWRFSRDILIAGVSFGIHQLIYITATQKTSIAVVALLGASQPLIVSVASSRLLGERVPKALFGSIVLALIGMAVVVHANFDAQSRSLEGDVLAAINVVFVTVYFLYSKRARMAGAPTLTLTASVLGISLMIAVPFAAWSGITQPDSRQWLWLLLLAFGSGNGHLLLNWAHRRVRAAFAALIISALPLFAALWAHLVLGEPFGWPHLVGMALVGLAIEWGRRSYGRPGKIVS